MDPKEEVTDDFLDTFAKMGEEHQDEVKSGMTKLAENIMTQGKFLPKDALGMSDQTIEQMYAQGYQLYNLGKYDDAHKVFGTLIMLNVTEPKYLFGFAACSHMMKDYELAADGYMRCSMLDSKNPIPFYHASDCFLKLDDKNSAMLTLHLAVERCGDHPEFAGMKERASMTLENLKTQVKEGKGKKADGSALKGEGPELKE